VLAPALVNVWGDHGHRLIGLTAAQALPDDTPWPSAARDRWACADSVRAWAEQRVLDDAGILGHLVGDERAAT
jgi:hypothetical protein